MSCEQAEMFAPEEAAEGGGVMAGFVGLAVHGTVEEVLVFHYDGEFGVVDTELGLGCLLAGGFFTWRNGVGWDREESIPDR